MLQGKRDVETVLTMGLMEDVSIIPQPAGGKESFLQIFLLDNIFSILLAFNDYYFFVYL